MADDVRDLMGGLQNAPIYKTSTSTTTTTKNPTPTLTTMTRRRTSQGVETSAMIGSTAAAAVDTRRPISSTTLPSTSPPRGPSRYGSTSATAAAGAAATAPVTTTAKRMSASRSHSREQEPPPPPPPPPPPSSFSTFSTSVGGGGGGGGGEFTGAMYDSENKSMGSASSNSRRSYSSSASRGHGHGRGGGGGGGGGGDGRRRRGGNGNSDDENDDDYHYEEEEDNEGGRYTTVGGAGASDARQQQQQQQQRRKSRARDGRQQRQQQQQQQGMGRRGMNDDADYYSRPGYNSDNNNNNNNDDDIGAGGGIPMVTTTRMMGRENYNYQEEEDDVIVVGGRNDHFVQQQQQEATDYSSLPGPMSVGRRTRGLDEAHVRQLVAQGFSTGLARALAFNALAFDHRIWVIDNSGSMQIGDGHRIAEGSKKDDIRAIPSTRWEEIQDTINYHAQMAALLNSPTIFRLLNDPGSRVGPQQFSVAERGEAYVEEDIHLAMDTMRKAKPGGVTPLTRHIWEIQQNIQEMAPQLIRDGKKVVVVLATDGLPTDEQGYGGEYITDEFIRALRSLEGLPIWLVVRLCTDEEPVTRFYNNLDGQLELSLEVLDDFIGEAREVYRYNKWLTYGLPMHRCRELGYHDRLFDLIDERPLTKGELRDFCVLLFGADNIDGIPDPGADWTGFIKYLKAQLKIERPQWNPIKKKVLPWINLKTLEKCYGEKSKCSIM